MAEENGYVVRWVGLVEDECLEEAFRKACVLLVWRVGCLPVVLITWRALQ